MERLTRYKGSMSVFLSDRLAVTGRRLDRRASGFSSSLPPARHVSACGRRATGTDTAAIYEPRVWRPLLYVRSGRSRPLGQVALTEFTAPGEPTQDRRGAAEVGLFLVFAFCRDWWLPFHL